MFRLAKISGFSESLQNRNLCLFSLVTLETFSAQVNNIYEEVLFKSSIE